MNNLVELHLHLDGALSIENIKKIAKIQSIDIPGDVEIRFAPVLHTKKG